MATATLNIVSIHAPWEGCDGEETPAKGRIAGFNSRTLGRVRLVLIVAGLIDEEFQFTHPGKGATCTYLSFPTVVTGFNSRTLGRVRQ